MSVSGFSSTTIQSLRAEKYLLNLVSITVLPEALTPVMSSAVLTGESDKKESLIESNWLEFEINNLEGLNNIENLFHAKKIISEKKLSGIPELKTVASTYRRWAKGILNAYKYNLSNGVTEGFNNKIKVLKRNSYGIRNFKHLRTRILHLSN